MNHDISIWSRGVDRDQFNPGRRSVEWRRSRGIGDGEMAVAFLGRVVMEKGSTCSRRRSTPPAPGAPPRAP